MAPTRCLACLFSSLFAAQIVLAAERPEISIASFEGSALEGWTRSGDAFAPVPHRPAKGFTGRNGVGVAWSGVAGVSATGKLESPEFKLQRRYLSYLVMGERNFPDTVGVELIVDGRVVRAASATEQLSFLFSDASAALEALHWRTWDVSAFEGKNARLRVNDGSKRGAIAVDAFLQSDAPKSAPLDASQRLHETYRPQFHYTPLRGWMNDPNGLVHYRGTWHLFHQHQDPVDDVIVWGHATSTDLFAWRHRPSAIPPDFPDNSSYSGSGLVDRWNASGLKKGSHDPLLLFYSRRPPGPKAVTLPAPPDLKRMTQEMAYSTDGGATWQRYKDNPVLTTPDYRDRDPKVIYLEAARTWFMLLPLSANNERAKATYGVFKSPDLKQWTLIQKLGPDPWYWECADLFELPVDGNRKNTRWMLLNGRGDYFIGRFDEKGFHAEAGPFTTKFGGHYYATQTFQDAPNGRRVQIGWMNSGPKPAVVNAFPGMPFNQQMSVPREINLRSTADGPRLFRVPVAEIEKLRTRSAKLPTGALTAGSNPLDGVNAELLDLEVDLTVGSAKRIVVTLRGEEIAYDVAKQTLHAFKSTAPLPLINGRLQLRLLLDRTSIEVFGNNGVADISGVFFPDPANRTMSLAATGGEANVTHLVVHELRPAWPQGSNSN